MNKHFKQFVIAQGVLFTTLGVFANPFINSKPVISRDTVADAKSNGKTVLSESMISFNAEYMSHEIDLHWNPGKGKNFTHFIVERSLDGNSFEKVGEVTAPDKNSSSQDYSFADYVKPSVARKNDLYYRLKQTDENNTLVYSKVLIVRMYNTKSVTAVSVTPDPTINDILVNVQLKENSFVAMTVKNKDGDLIMKKTAHADSGANSFSL
ncbi:MAG: hypothetical protein JST96_07285, partial [Bacteroidetes bacterium]|nr:hypothetical protein [Bacteroidota bacterium]